MQSHGGPPPRPQQLHPTPPVPPRIPLQAVQTLIPRLTTTINDIDAFQRVLAETSMDGSLPNWDALLQRYSLLLGRINGLAQTIGRLPAGGSASSGLGTASATASSGATRTFPPPPPSISATTTTTTAAAAASSQSPALQGFIVHPLNALPSDTSNPMAPDVFFQVINTQLLPSVKAAREGLLSRPEWASADELKRMGPEELGVAEQRLRDRLEREHVMARKILEEIQAREEEVDWTVRIGGDEVDADGDGDEGHADGDGDGDGEGPAKDEDRVATVSGTDKDKDKDKDDDDDDDLFGDDDDEPVVVPSPIPQKQQASNPQASSDSPPPNPRLGWALTDYVRYMDTGKEPTRQDRGP